jgi:flagellar hook-basal body complex protein FliE
MYELLTTAEAASHSTAQSSDKAEKSEVVKALELFNNAIDSIKSTKRSHDEKTQAAITEGTNKLAAKLVAEGKTSEAVFVLRTNPL